MGNGLTDGGVIDIARSDLAELLAADQSSLMTALDRVLASSREDALLKSFTASI